MEIFGVGSLVFLLSEPPAASGTFDLLKFRNDIVSSIAGIENVSNLRTENVDDLRVGFRSFEEDEDDDLLIIPCGLSMSFDLMLPHRIQVNYGAELPVETISVRIEYAYDRPVMYCSFDADDTADLYSAQMVVMVVRKYLAQKLSGTIRCKSIAPSPFHANFYISRSDRSDVELIDRSMSRSGIANIEVSVPNDGDPIDHVVRQYNETFSRFYYLSTLRRLLIRERTGIVNGITEIIENPSKGIWDSWTSFFSMRRDIDEVQRQVVHERLDRIRADDYINEARGADQLGDRTPLSRFFDEYMGMSRQGIWAEFAQVATFFEDRRHRVMGNVSVLTAGVIGGIIGALITGAATLYSAQDEKIDSGPLQMIERPHGGEKNGLDEVRAPEKQLQPAERSETRESRAR